MYTRKEILELLKPSPAWVGCDDWIYIKKETNLKNALHELHTAWDIIQDFERPTFIDLAKQILETPALELPQDKMANLTKIKKGFNDAIVRVPVFLYGDLNKCWPDDFPISKTICNKEYVAEDVNHRLTAYALKFLEDKTIGNIPTEIYYGSKP
jgi:hypothetical protein